MMHLQATGQHKNKQTSHIIQYITHLHQHTWSIHNSYMSKCTYKILQIFSRVLNLRLMSFLWNSQKLMHHEYYHVYSIFINTAATILSKDNIFTRVKYIRLRVIHYFMTTFKALIQGMLPSIWPFRIVWDSHTYNLPARTTNSICWIRQKQYFQNNFTSGLPVLNTCYHYQAQIHVIVSLLF